MELFQKRYKKYKELQKRFNRNKTLENQRSIFNELTDNKATMAVMATFVEKYEKSSKTKRISIHPMYILKDDDAIPFELSNNRIGSVYRPIYALNRGIDNEKWELIKKLDQSKPFKCEIYLHDYLHDKEIDRINYDAVFSFDPKTIEEIGENNYNDLGGRCSLYQLFDKEKPNELKEWHYSDFLILLQDDRLDDNLDKVKSELIEERKKLSEEIETFKIKRNRLRDTEIPAQERIKNELIKQNTKLDEIKLKKEALLKPFLLDANIDSIPPESSNRDVNEENIAFSHIDDDSVIISIQGKLKSDAELEYSKAVIEQMCAGLHTNQLIVLVGDPGSGKTSLASYFGKCLPSEGETKIIPVQPGWMDKSDLLGYYNPIEKSYVPTDFLDTLIDYCSDAKKNPGKYYFICLDEMNLSQIEYYFADFLSKLQTDRTISLYSSTIYEEIRSDYLRQAERFVKMHKGAIDDIGAYTTREEFEEYLKLEHTKKSLKRYKSEIIIPENVKFIGTLNQDETTKDISPKVLDRSIVIKLQNNVQKEILAEEKNPKEQTPTKMDSREEHWKEMISALENHKITVSKRLDNVFEQLDPLFKDNDRFFDAVISTMILPKINFSPYQIDIGKIKAILGKYCNSARISSNRIYQDMDKRCGNEQQDLLTFWSK